MMKRLVCSLMCVGSLAIAAEMHITCDFDSVKQPDHFVQGKYRFEVNMKKRKAVVHCLSKECGLPVEKDTWKVTMNTFKKGEGGYVVLKGHNHDDTDLMAMLNFRDDGKWSSGFMISSVEHVDGQLSPGASVECKAELK